LYGGSRSIVVGVDASAQLQINFGQHPYKFAQTPYATLVAAETLRAKLEAKRYVTHITLDKVRVFFFDRNARKRKTDRRCLGWVWKHHTHTHAHTQPIYRPKDTMYFRGWVLDAHDQSPVGQQLANSLKAKLQIFSPADAEVLTITAAHCSLFSHLCAGAHFHRSIRQRCRVRSLARLRARGPFPMVLLVATTELKSATRSISTPTHLRILTPLCVIYCLFSLLNSPACLRRSASSTSASSALVRASAFLIFYYTIG
jgi:hypothetical protein